MKVKGNEEETPFTNSYKVARLFIDLFCGQGQGTRARNQDLNPLIGVLRKL